MTKSLSISNQNPKTGYFHLAPYAILLMTVVDVVLQGRSFDDIYALLATEVTRNPWNIWFVRIVSVFLVSASLERIYAGWNIRGCWQGSKPSLTYCFLLFWFGSQGFSMVFASHPLFEHHFFYTLIIGLGLLSLTLEDAGKFMLALRNALILYLASGFLMLLIKPSLVLDFGYSQGYIPGLPRFSGFAPFALMLGQLALLSTLLLLTYPFKKRAINIGGMAISIAAVILSQSKTAWIAALVLAAIVFWYGRKPLPNTLNAANPFAFLLLAGIFLFFGSAILFFVLSDSSEALGKFTASSAGSQLASLNGRDVIWNFSLSEWSKSPIFGFGMNFLELPHRIAVKLLNATHAHNQFIDLLVRSGIVGLASVLPYLTVIFLMVRKAKIPYKGLAAGILALELIESIAEVPFSLRTYGPLFLVQMSLLAVILMSHQSHAEVNVLANGSPMRRRS